jgi:opacity protein-like surface antigen
LLIASSSAPLSIDGRCGSGPQQIVYCTRELEDLVNRVLQCVVASAIVLCAWPASAQDPRVEIGATVGWTISDGVSGDPVIIPGAGAFDSIAPKDAVSLGVRLGFFVNPQVEVGFLFNQQWSSLEVGGILDAGGGATTVELGDEAVRNYHGYFAYNFGEADANVRPYVLGGIGATQYGKVDARLGNVQREIGGTSRFSTTWGGGLKFQTSESVGFRLEGRWTPTFIKAEAVGWWCDPFWGCYLLSDAQYSNQFDLAGGVSLRF